MLIVIVLVALFSSFELVKARQTAAQRLTHVLNGLQAESLYVDQNDVGVKACNFVFTMQNPAYPFSPKALKVELGLQMKYTYWNGTASIKYVVTASTKDLFHAPKDKMAFTQLLTLVQTNPSDTRPTLSHTFEVSAVLESYWDPPNQALMVYGNSTSFFLGLEEISQRHPRWNLTLGSGGESTVCSWSPASDMNLLDGRGIFAPPALDQSTSRVQGVAKEREMFVLIKPIQIFTPSVIGPLLFRHVEYYRALGVSKHIVYISKASKPSEPLISNHDSYL
jgi:hypothetical protein